MRNTIRQVLAKIKDDFGDERIFTTPKRFRAVLNDVKIEEEETRVRNLLNIAIRDINAYSRLKSELTNCELLIANLTEEMSTNYMIDKKATQMVLECIAELLGFGPFEANDADSNIDFDGNSMMYTSLSSKKILSDFGQDELKIGRDYYDKLDFKSAQRYLQIAADRGNAEAQCALGLLFSDNRNPNRNDNLSLKWYEKAAELGHSEAQWLIGLRFLDGRGCDKDLSKAKFWLQKSADQYNKDGQYALAAYYAAVKDYDNAIPWLKKAAVKGHVQAAETLYAMGISS